MIKTIAEIRTARRVLEAQLLREISAAVNNFQEATGVRIRGIVVGTTGFTHLAKERDTVVVSEVTIDLERL